MSAASLGQRGSLACLVAVALTATACGGSSGSSAAGKASNSTAPAVTSATTTAAAAASTAAAITSAATASSAVSGAAVTSAAATSAAGSPIVLPSSVAPPTKVVAKGGGQFCKEIADVANDEAPDVTGAAAAQKAQADKSLKELAQLAADAPSSIRGDVTTLATAIGSFYSAYAKAGYDPTKLPASAETAMTTPAVQTAEKNLEAYTKGVCGIDVASG